MRLSRYHNRRYYRNRLLRRLRYEQRLWLDGRIRIFPDTSLSILTDLIKALLLLFRRYASYGAHRVISYRYNNIYDFCPVLTVAGGEGMGYAKMIVMMFSFYPLQ